LRPITADIAAQGTSRNPNEDASVVDRCCSRAAQDEGDRAFPINRC
jgi:hypothetical protein